MLTWTDFSASLTVWDLQSGKSIEIRDPKFHTGPETRHTEEGPGWAYKPLPEYLNDEEGLEQERHGHNRIFALLSRVGPRDILTVHASRNYEVIGSTDLPSIDARGLKWSPDGRWLAVWEAPSQGMRIWVYTADGHLFRTYPATANAGVADAELGIRSLEWSPSSDWLAVGGFDRRVTLLNTRTVSPFLTYQLLIQTWSCDAVVETIKLMLHSSLPLCSTWIIHPTSIYRFPRQFTPKSYHPQQTLVDRTLELLSPLLCLLRFPSIRLTVTLPPIRRPTRAYHQGYPILHSTRQVRSSPHYRPPIPPQSGPGTCNVSYHEPSSSSRSP